jgi:hypothetical protein
MFESTLNKLYREVFLDQHRDSEYSSEGANTAGKPVISKTVGTQFKEQLIA